MKFSLPLKLATLATVTLATAWGVQSAQASLFGQQEVQDPNAFGIIASPFGSNQYSLLVIEQLPGKRQCWAENGFNPTFIDPLWTTFDFTGHCKRSSDSNGYSIRINGEDFALDYLLRPVWRNGEVQLLGTPRTGSRPGLQEIIIARSGGGAPGNYHKLNLVDGWRLTRRTYEGNTLGHLYFTNEGNLMPPPPVAENPTPLPTPTPTPSPTPSPVPTPTPTPSPTPTPTFPDISNDIYRREIEQAVEVGFISGFFEDNTFRPLTSLTREQLVSMAIESLGAIDGVNPNVPQSASAAPFPDVAANRWSAAKIQWAKNSGIITGYPDGTFKPAQPVTRAELMVVMKKTAEYAKAQQGKPIALSPTQAVFQFSDTTNHWARGLIAEMSAYCGAASPVNEQGTNFAPNSPALRNYAAAATLRMYNCVQGGA